MGRIAGVPNKITTQVKEKLEELIDGIVNSIDIEELTTNQKIKMLQISLQDTLPRMQASVISNKTEDLPLFIDQCQISAKKMTNFKLNLIVKKRFPLISQSPFIKG